MQIGRFTTHDPLSEQFLYNSPYAFSENKVTSHVELEGLEAFPINNAFNTIGSGLGWNYAANHPASQQSIGNMVYRSNHYGAVGALAAGSLTAAGMGGYLAAPAIATWTLGNPIAANEIFTGGLAMAAGYPGELPTAGSGKGFSKMADELSSGGGKVMEEASEFLKGFDTHIGDAGIGLKSFVGTEKGRSGLDGDVTPNSIYTHVAESNGKAISNYIYNAEGKVKYQVDFDKHGPGLSGHGHEMKIPGDLGSGHGGLHIQYDLVPKQYQQLPSGIEPNKPIGGL